MSPFDLRLAHGYRDRQCAAHSAQRAIETQFAYQCGVGQMAFLKSPVSAENPNRHGQVEAGALFLNVSGS
ncbi:MAG: hypothetical protein NVS1B6_18630 [Steroidobacteraceae bacterium]